MVFSFYITTTVLSIPTPYLPYVILCVCVCMRACARAHQWDNINMMIELTQWGNQQLSEKLVMLYFLIVAYTEYSRSGLSWATSLH